MELSHLRKILAVLLITKKSLSKTIVLKQIIYNTKFYLPNQIITLC